jgi:hypothetical protein
MDTQLVASSWRADGSRRALVGGPGGGEQLVAVLLAGESGGFERVRAAIGG